MYGIIVKKKTYSLAFYRLCFWLGWFKECFISNKDRAALQDGEADCPIFNNTKENWEEVK
ncbi:hypothetical protein [Lacrimispora brassicae]